MPSGKTYTYDANGNLTSDGTNCYQYNQANQLDKVTKCSNGETIAEYVYDYNGNRMVKRNFTSGLQTNSVVSWSDAFETTVATSGAQLSSTSYYFANGQLISKKDNSGNRTYIHNDHLGSANVVTNSSGSVIETTQYDPWGKINIGGTAIKFLYTGQEHDSETNLNYYNARYYDPHIRRFTQPDTLVQNIYDPQYLNRYSYARNNPLKYTDPTGHAASILDWNNFLSNPSAKAYNDVMKQFASIPGNTAKTFASSGSSGSSSSGGGGGNSSGSVHGSATSNSSSGNTSKPAAPNIFTLRENMKIAQMMRLLPLNYRAAWFAYMVREGGPWDYKDENQYGPGAAPNGKYSGNENFGNVNYGLTGAAAGFHPQVLHRAAGSVQQATNEMQRQQGREDRVVDTESMPWKGYPYGDSFEKGRSIDQEMIGVGTEAYYSPW